MGILPLFSPTSAWRIARLVRLISRSVPTPRSRLRYRKGPNMGLKHGQLQKTYVAIESLLTWQVSQEDLKRLLLSAAEQGVAQLRRGP